METVICKVLVSVLVFTVIQTAAQQIDLEEFTTSLNVDVSYNITHFLCPFSTLLFFYH